MTNSIAKKIFASAVALSSAFMGFAPQAALAVSAGEVYKTSDGTVWFITSDMQRRAFTSGGAFLSYGFLSFSQVMDATSEVTSLTAGAFIPPQDGGIFCATMTKGSDVAGECSLVTGGMKAAFTSSAVFTGQGFSFARADYGDSSFLTKTSNIDNAGAAHRAGVLINIDGTVYLVGSTTLMGIPSVSVFESWGYSFADVVTANAADRSMAKGGIMASRTPGHLSPSTTSSNDDDQTASCTDLQGTTGSLSFDDLGDFSGEEVGEGDEEVPVMSFEVEADNDSDVAITSVKVELDENGSGSEDLEDYATEVTIWHGDDMVGSADVEDFDETSTDGTWTKTITLDCVAIASDEMEELTVAISANNIIDSNDLNQAWIADVISVRFEDGDGVVTTEDTDGDELQKTFTFQSFATATDVELNTSLTDDSDDINEAHVLDIDDTDDTSDVEVFAFTLENKGDSDVTVNDIPVVITVTGDEATKLLNATLWMDGEQISSDTVPTGGAVEFEDLDLEIDAGDSVDLVVAVDAQDTGPITNGDTISATVTVASIDADDEQGDELASGDLTGSAVSEASAFFDEGIMVELVSTDTSVDYGDPTATNDHDLATFTYVFDVTAFDGDAYVDNTAPALVGGGTAHDLGQVQGAGTVASADIASQDNSIEGTNSFLVEEGTTERFTITVVVTPTTDALHQWDVDSILYAPEASGDVDGTVDYTFNLDDFRSDAVFLNNDAA